MNTTYDPSMNEQAFNLALLGFDDVEIAMVLGISTATLTAWKRRHPEFLAALKRGGLQADSDVVASLHKRAVGYEFTEVRTVTDAELLEGFDHDEFIKSLETEFEAFNAEFTMDLEPFELDLTTPVLDLTTEPLVFDTVPVCK